MGTSRGISSGSFCRSASIVATIWPRAASNPASNAADCPPFCAIRSTRSQGCFTIPSRSSLGVSSVLPSSTRITSNGFPSTANAESTRDRSTSTFSCSL